MEDLLPFDLPADKSSIIKVIGVGGGGSNAVNHMFKQGITDVDFVVCNTDQQALAISPVQIKIHLGQTLTEGLGAGNQPERGKEAAIENLDDILQVLGNNTKMTFITAGMGGGTGTGAAPIIAKASKDLGILTVGIVTIPFMFEGKKRINQAIEGVREISKHVDSLLVINNERLREIYGELEIAEAFSKADNVLTVAAKGIAEIITKKGHVNVDFADVKTVMANSGVAIMGSGQAEGENRAKEAVEEALKSPLLNNSDITGAKNILINISFDEVGLKTDELIQITKFAQNEAGDTADIIWGYNHDETLGEKLNVTIIATGFETDIIPELYVNKSNTKKVVNKSKIAEHSISDNIDFEVNYTNDDLNLISQKIKPQITKQSLVEDDFITENIDDEIKLHKKETKSDNETDEEENIKLALERMKLIEKAKKQLQNPKNKKIDNNSKSIDELENEPAYKRRNVDLNQKNNIINTEISRFVLSDDDDDSELTENTFLHDNVD
ncbi:MAG: cell division protein FtsZ [Bacteroidales bacterium]|nr:cell division protein FtsZ [Bacteroidales bacterium]MBN2756855.1 cell division protein FtsZ [Bacteroidales bacterium]